MRCWQPRRIGRQRTTSMPLPDDAHDLELGMSTQSDTGFLGRILETVATWHQRSQERQALSLLSERQRRDIGLSPRTIDDEIGKPFWRG